MATSKPSPRDVLAQAALSDSVRALAERGEVRSYRKGTLLIQEGDVGDTIYVILEGRLRAFGSDARSEREITYETYGPGEYVGEMGLDGGPRSASVEALAASVCSVVSRATLQAHLAQHPEFAFELLTRVIRRARAATQSTKQMALTDVYGRLRALVDAQAVAAEDGTRVIDPRPTHRELAERLGCVRERISLVLKQLETGGYLRAEGSGWVIARPWPQRW